MKSLLLALVLILAAGCGSHDTGKPSTPKAAGTVEEWQAELASSGYTPPSWERWESFTRETLCGDDSYEYYVTLSRDPGGPSLNQERTGLKYACPENLKAWDAAVVQLGETTDRVDYICEEPFESMKPYDQHEALIVCDQYQTPAWERYYNEHFPPEVEATLAP